MSESHEMRVRISGFPWEDREYRFLAFDGRHFGYGPTPEIAVKRYAEAEAEAS